MASFTSNSINRVIDSLDLIASADKLKPAFLIPDKINNAYKIALIGSSNSSVKFDYAGDTTGATTSTLDVIASSDVYEFLSDTTTTTNNKLTFGKKYLVGPSSATIFTSTVALSFASTLDDDAWLAAQNSSIDIYFSDYLCTGAAAPALTTAVGGTMPTAVTLSLNSGMKVAAFGATLNSQAQIASTSISFNVYGEGVRLVLTKYTKAVVATSTAASWAIAAIPLAGNPIYL